MVQSYNTLLAEGAISISSRPQSASTSRARIDAANKVPGGPDQASIASCTQQPSNQTQHVSHPCPCRCQGVCELSVRCWRHPGWPAGLPGCAQTPRITATHVSHVSFRQPKVPAAESASSSGELSLWPLAGPPWGTNGQQLALLETPQCCMSDRCCAPAYWCQVLYTYILVSSSHLGLPGTQHTCSMFAWHGHRACPE